jgi:hypothetical protein
MTETQTKMMWASKFALTSRIIELPVRFPDHTDQRAYDARPGSNGWTSFKVGADIHETYAEAVTAAEAARVKKIASLKKQIAKLEKHDFSALES